MGSNLLPNHFLSSFSLIGDTYCVLGRCLRWSKCHKAWWKAPIQALTDIWSPSQLCFIVSFCPVFLLWHILFLFHPIYRLFCVTAATSIFCPSLITSSLYHFLSLSLLLLLFFLVGHSAASFISSMPLMTMCEHRDA